ncbi:MAG: AMP-binding protein, partial [Pseudomonadota bacterium]
MNELGLEAKTTTGRIGEYRMKETSNVISLFEEAVQSYGDQPFLISEDRTYSFVEIDQLSSKLSDGLRHLGVKPGDHVAFCLEGGMEVVVTRLAVQKLGAIVVPINNRLIGPEIEYILRNSESNWVVVHNSFLPHFQQITIPALLERTIVVGEVPPGIKAVSYQEVLAKGSPLAADRTIDPESTAIIVYTSGTTGHPKGAVIRHCNSVASGQYVSHWAGMRRGDILLSSTPMYNSSSLDGYFLASMMNGVPWVLTRRFSPKDVLDKIEQFSVTIYHAAGPLIAMVIAHESFSKRNLSSLRIVNWSNLLPFGFVEQLLKALPTIDMV